MGVFVDGLNLDWYSACTLCLSVSREVNSPLRTDLHWC